MENHNQQQNRDREDNGGNFVNMIGKTFENMVETITGETDENTNQERSRKKQ